MLPPELQELFEISTRRDVNEAMCVLYVALTRAIHALYMIVSPSAANEKNLHKTPAGLLRAALTDAQRLQPEDKAYQCGDPLWYEHEQPQVMAATVATAEPQEVEIELAPQVGDAQLDHTAPSALEGGTRVAAVRVLDLASSVATSRGTLIHALFEQITWLEDGIPERTELRQVADRLGCQRPECGGTTGYLPANARPAGNRRGTTT